MQGEIIVLSLDTGTFKCGLAIVSNKRGLLHKEVVSVENLVPRIKELKGEFNIHKFILGDGTNSKEIAKILMLKNIADLQNNLIFIDETNSTLQARERYFKENKPKGIRRFIPLGLQVPPVPYDDYVAAILAERYFFLVNKNDILR